MYKNVFAWYDMKESSTTSADVSLFQLSTTANVSNNVDAFQNDTTPVTIDDSGVPELDFIINGNSGVVVLANMPTTWSADIVLASIQWFIFIFGTIANLVVLLLLVWCRSKRQLVTQLFVGSLTLANLVLLLSSGWVLGILYFNGNDWKFGSVGCKAQYFLQTVAPYCAVWTLAFLAIDRLIGVSRPIGESLVTCRKAIIIVVIIWTSMIAINLPILFWATAWHDSVTSMTSCMLTDVNKMPRSAYIACTRLLDYFIPFAINWISYMGIIYKFRQSVARVSHFSTNATVAESTWRRQTTTQSPTFTTSGRKVTLMCVAIAVSFTVTTLPYQVNVMIVVLSTDITAIANASQAINPLRTVTMLNTCFNPIIYGLMWRPFQQALVQVTRRLIVKCFSTNVAPSSLQTVSQLVTSSNEDGVVAATSRQKGDDSTRNEHRNHKSEANLQTASSEA